MAPIQFIPLRTDSEKQKQAARLLYESSFPSGERRRWAAICTLAEKEERFVFLRLASESCPMLGILALWQLDFGYFGEYLAVAPEQRNGGWGSKILQQLLTQLNAQPLVIEVEPPLEPMAARRIAFYERHGLLLRNVDYLQPAYHENEPPLPLKIMTYGVMNDASLQIAIHEIHRVVYHPSSF